jgi:hypothetical protein
MISYIMETISFHLYLRTFFLFSSEDNWSYND